LEDGSGVSKDVAEAAKYFKMSADQGNSEGQWRYGRCLFGGCGVPKDLAEGAKYLKLAADQGQADARYEYGRALRIGRGVAKDPVEAAKYSRLAADRGSDSDVAPGYSSSSLDELPETDSESDEYVDLAPPKPLSTKTLPKPNIQ
jgi:TPR repeat protein